MLCGAPTAVSALSCPLLSDGPLKPDAGLLRWSRIARAARKGIVTTTAPTQTDAPRVDAEPKVANWAFVAALAVIVAAAVWVLWRERGWLSSSDLAFFEIELMRIPDQWPLVGAYSRYGWSHPGPLQYYLMLGPWRLLGGASVGLMFGMLLLHLAAVVIAWFAVRRRSQGAAVLVVGALLIVWAGTASEALMPWNPLVGLLFGGTLLVLAWNAATRGRIGALLLLATGTLLIQAHVSTAPVVVFVCVVAVGLALWSTGQRDAIPWRSWLIGTLLAAILWIPPLIDQFTGSGNLRQIAAAAANGGPSVGLRQAATTLIDVFTLPPYWWNPDVSYLPTEWAPPWLLLVPVAALVVAAVRRDPVQLRFLALAATALVVAWLSVSRFLDPFTYLGAWIPGMAMVTVAVSLWILVDAADVDRILLIASPVLLLLPAIAVAITLVTSPPPLPYNTEITRDGSAAIIANELDDPGVHLNTQSFDVLPALVAELQARGVPVSATTPDDWPTHLKSLIPSDPGDRTQIRIRDVWDPGEPAPDGWRVIAEGDPFTAEEWHEIVELRRASVDEGATDEQRAVSVWVLAALVDSRFAWQVLAPVD